MQGQWLGQWDGAWLGDGQPSAPGAMSALLVGLGGLSGSLVADTAIEPVAPSGNMGFTMRRVYVRRGKKLHLFASAQEADDFIEAEQIAEQAVQKARKTSRLARKRIRDKVFKPLPIETIEVDRLAQLVSHFNIPVDFPQLIAEQDWARVMQIMALAREMQDEEDLEMLLLA
jgi:hypothetical protein